MKRHPTPIATGTNLMSTSKNVTPDVLCESRADRIGKMTGQSQAWVDGMLIHRQGEQPDSNMTAIGLHRVVNNREIYRVSVQQGLTPTHDHQHVLDLEALVKTTPHDTPPDHTTVSAVWDKRAVVQRDTENILGDNVIFQINSDATDIGIPVLEATPERLGYYGAILVHEGAVVRFPNHAYPIWKMALGRSYIDGFILTPQGKGFYLEYHHDRPHWHQPLTPDSGGYYILAKEVGTAAAGYSHYQLTGFHIPYRKAVYTSQGAIHCDAALTGTNWLVGYTDSQDFSTALVRNAYGALAKLSGKNR